MLVFFLFFGDNNIGHTLLFPAPTQPTPNGTMVYCPTALDIPRKEGRVFRDSHLNATNPLAPICSKKLFLPFGSKRVFLQGLLAPDEAAREVSQQGTFDGRLGNWPHQCQRSALGAVERVVSIVVKVYTGQDLSMSCMYQKVTEIKGAPKTMKHIHGALSASSFPLCGAWILPNGCVEILLLHF